MNWTSMLTTFVPLLLQLIQDPKFQALAKAILGLFHTQVQAGVHPEVAAQRAGGLLSAAAMLHLTGNPAADFEQLLANIQTQNTQKPSSPSGGASGGFTS